MTFLWRNSLKLSTCYFLKMFEPDIVVGCQQNLVVTKFLQQ